MESVSREQSDSSNRGGARADVPQRTDEMSLDQKKELVTMFSGQLKKMYEALIRLGTGSDTAVLRINHSELLKQGMFLYEKDDKVRLRYPDTFDYVSKRVGSCSFAKKGFLSNEENFREFLDRWKVGSKPKVDGLEYVVSAAGDIDGDCSEQERDIINCCLVATVDALRDWCISKNLEGDSWRKDAGDGVFNLFFGSKCYLNFDVNSDDLRKSATVESDISQLVEEVNKRVDEVLPRVIGRLEYYDKHPNASFFERYDHESSLRSIGDDSEETEQKPRKSFNVPEMEALSLQDRDAASEDKEGDGPPKLPGFEVQ